MLNLRKLTHCTLLSAVMLCAQGVLAMEGAQKGLEISKEYKSRDTGWGDSSSEIKMILRNTEGQESIRKITFNTLEQLSDGDKSLTVFVEPYDLKGTAFLSFSHPVGADDQWLYLPALKRVKRISSSNKSGPFMGSEFAYEDLSSFEVQKYTYNYLGEEEANGLQSHKIEQFPVDENSGYKRRIVWIDKEAYRIQKIEFYDRKDTLLKTLTYSGYNKYIEGFWRPDNAKMVNHQSGKSTVLEFYNYQFREGLSDSDFSQSSLKRLR
ncbi:outer membrane lipoprotein-sorting protein [Pseudoalteromonas sp. MMG022]|uniref:outer membrane lipoprotein-sorting protein n=1 Tax=Pseudoalteromonas sp. MMG022 TaxID=2909978 RepID=UPI0031BA99B0